MYGNLVNFIGLVIPERNMLVFQVELGLMGTLRVQLQTTFRAYSQGSFARSGRSELITSADLEVSP